MELIEISARDANHRLSELLSEVERTGQGYLVTKRGRPVARILPVEDGKRELTPEQRAALDFLLKSPGYKLEPGKLTRDEMHDRTALRD